jgi:prepilin-type N-terminal cleavage/methylation domain-containing protein
MKNIQLNTSRKAGFSLFEMLVVIAIIGIVAAIAIPNLGNLNDTAKVAAGRRNAQMITSVLNAAVAAGVDTAGWTTSNLITKAEDGVTPTQGPFANRRFTSGDINSNEEAEAAKYLEWDSTNKQVKYQRGH